MFWNPSTISVARALGKGSHGSVEGWRVTVAVAATCARGGGEPLGGLFPVPPRSLQLCDLGRPVASVLSFLVRNGIWSLPPPPSSGFWEWEKGAPVG